MSKKVKLIKIDHCLVCPHSLIQEGMLVCMNSKTIFSNIAKVKSVDVDMAIPEWCELEDERKEVLIQEEQRNECFAYLKYLKYVKYFDETYETDGVCIREMLQRKFPELTAGQINHLIIEWKELKR